LDDFAKRAADATEANRRVLGIGLAEAQREAPIKTRELIGSITIDATADGGELSVGVAYAPFQEFGTRYVRGRRFVKAGADAMTDAAEPIYSDHLSHAISSAGG
jgi:hypothetical protein